MEKKLVSLFEAKAIAEKEAITNTLLYTKNDLKKAALILKIDRTNLKNKIKKYDLENFSNTTKS